MNNSYDTFENNLLFFKKTENKIYATKLHSIFSQ